MERQSTEQLRPFVPGTIIWNCLLFESSWHTFPPYNFLSPFFYVDQRLWIIFRRRSTSTYFLPIDLSSSDFLLCLNSLWGDRSEIWRSLHCVGTNRIVVSIIRGPKKMSKKPTRVKIEEKNGKKIILRRHQMYFNLRHIWWNLEIPVRRKIYEPRAVEGITNNFDF